MDTEFFGNDTEQKQTLIGAEQIAEATATLQKYKQGKSYLEERIVDDEMWWKLRHWESFRKNKKNVSPEPASAWLFNAITNKHADAMDNFPEPVVLPRERSDEQSAETLSAILPVIMEYNDFEQTYSDNWWDKLKHGTCAYMVAWNPEKENGLGDVDIKALDLLKVFWEAGVTDIQKSRNLFIVDLVDKDILEERYPQLKGKMQSSTVDIKEYLYDDTIDNSDKAEVVDWYYKVKSSNGKTILHYCKFVGNEVLFATENEPNYRDVGWYDHGLYPVVFDTLFPEKGTPVGFGYVTICKEPQLYIDKLSGNILENAMMTTKKRFFVSSATNVNKEQFADWTQGIIDVEGELDDTRIKEIKTSPLDPIYLNVINMKIDEMKDTASNRDVNSGGTGSGVTAAAAIAALQEAGNKASRDMISASYRSFSQIANLVIELIRQFYDETRAFRITGMAGDYQFIDVSNAPIREQQIGIDAMGNPLFRKPVFDLKIKAVKSNPFSRMEENERAKELFAAGFFSPAKAQEAMGALEMMNFEGIEKVKDYVKTGQTLQNMLEQLLGVMNAQAPMTPAGSPNVDVKTPMTDGVLEAQTPMTGYGQRLAARSKPSVG